MSASMSSSRSSNFRNHHNYIVYNEDFKKQQKHEQNYCLCSVLGTPAYRPTEVINLLPFGMSVYLFSCGVSLYVSLSGTLPFRQDTPRKGFHAIFFGHLGFPRTRWAVVSPTVHELCRRLLDVKLSQRLTERGD